MKRTITSIVAALCLLSPAATVVATDAEQWRERLTELAEDPARGAANLQRNQYRHPVETLMFFGIEPQMYLHF